MAETVNTGAILTSDGHGGYSKLFTESMTDIVKLQNGSSLTEKLAEIDGKLPIVLTSGQLPETLGIGKVAFACDTSGNMKILAGKIDNSTLEILTSESGVLRYEEVSGETVNPFVVDADTLGGSTKEQIISEAQSGVDLSNIDAATLEGHAANYFATASDMNSCFQSVSEGKSAIASAITDKGVSTASDATFQTMANNISLIETLTGTAIEFPVEIVCISNGSVHDSDLPSEEIYALIISAYGDHPNYYGYKLAKITNSTAELLANEGADTWKNEYTFEKDPDGRWNVWESGYMGTLSNVGLYFKPKA